MSPRLVPAARGGATVKALAVGAALHSGGAEGALRFSPDSRPRADIPEGPSRARCRPIIGSALQTSHIDLGSHFSRLFQIQRFRQVGDPSITRSQWLQPETGFDQL
jgi:hypothetical protein